MSKGLTLIEIIIVLAIFLMLISLGAFSLISQSGKGRDAKRKDDLERIRVAFEDYYNDNGQYPDAGDIGTCDSEDLFPYLNSVPCDPTTHGPYIIVVDGSSGINASYWIYTFLENESDPAIERLGLTGEVMVGAGGGIG